MYVHQHICVYMHTCHVMRVEIRVQFSGVSSLLPPVHPHIDLGFSALAAATSTC